MKKTIKINESQLRNMIREAINELNYKTYMNAAKKRSAQGKDANARELADMAKSRFDDEFNDNYKYDTLGDKLVGRHSKTFDSVFTDLDTPKVRGRNEKGEDLFRVNGKYYNSSRGLTTPEKFFKDKDMSATFNKATKELDDYNSGAYDYTDEKGWHLKESKLNRIVKESVKKVLNEQLDFVDREELAKKFLQWATSNESQQKINAMEAMYEYYNNDDEEYLYRAAEVFSEVSGDDVNDVLDAAKMAANHYFYYNN